MIDTNMFSLTELESMIPFEREVYTFFLIDKMNKKKQQQQE